MLYKTLGIVLRHFNFGEANKIVTFYSSRFGKIKAVVKGVRKTKSKFGSSMELFTNNNLLLYHKENRELYLVTQSSIVDSFRELREDLNKLYKASYVVEVVDSLVKGSEKNQFIFDMIVSTLSLLRCSNSESEIEKILRLFEIRFLTVLGYKLKLDKYSIHNIGLSYPVSSDSINIMESMQNTEIEDAKKLKLSEQNQIELKKILPNFIRYYAEREINTLKFINH